MTGLWSSVRQDGRPDTTHSESTAFQLHCPKAVNAKVGQSKCRAPDIALEAVVETAAHIPAMRQSAISAHRAVAIADTATPESIAG